VEQSATFLVASILICLGMLTIVGALVIVNNLLHKYWKPVKIFSADSWHINPPPRFIEPSDDVHKLDKEMPWGNNKDVMNDIKKEKT
jgi:hypothetical protein